LLLLLSSSSSLLLLSSSLSSLSSLLLLLVVVVYTTQFVSAVSKGFFRQREINDIGQLKKTIIKLGLRWKGCCTLYPIFSFTSFFEGHMNADRGKVHIKKASFCFFNEHNHFLATVLLY